MRCPDCNKFVGQEPGDIEVNSLEINDGEVSCSARLPINCAECNSELKSGEFELTATVPEEALKDHQGENHDIGIEEDGAEAVDEYQTTDRRGKPIKNPRYQAHLYGVLVNFSVRCSCQERGAEALFSDALTDKMPASNFDES